MFRHTQAPLAGLLSYSDFKALIEELLQARRKKHYLAAPVRLSHDLQHPTSVSVSRVGYVELSKRAMTAGALDANTNELIALGTPPLGCFQTSSRVRLAHRLNSLCVARRDADRSGEVITDDVFARLLTFPNVLITASRFSHTRGARRHRGDHLANLSDLDAGRQCANEVSRA